MRLSNFIIEVNEHIMTGSLLLQKKVMLNECLKYSLLFVHMAPKLHTLNNLGSAASKTTISNETVVQGQKFNISNSLKKTSHHNSQEDVNSNRTRSQQAKRQKILLSRLNV